MVATKEQDMSKDANSKYEAAMVAEFGRPAAQGKKLVRNMMSNKVIEIDADTPYACDPSTERYWSM
jgi:hypothetical protein